MKSAFNPKDKVAAMVAAAKRCEKAAVINKLPDARAVGEASTFYGFLQDAIERGRLFTPERVAVIAPIICEIMLEEWKQYPEAKQRIDELTVLLDQSNNTGLATVEMVRNLLGYL